MHIHGQSTFMHIYRQYESSSFLTVMISQLAGGMCVHMQLILYCISPFLSNLFCKVKMYLFGWLHVPPHSILTDRHNPEKQHESIIMATGLVWAFNIKLNFVNERNAHNAGIYTTFIRNWMDWQHTILIQPASNALNYNTNLVVLWQPNLTDSISSNRI